jgi:hypothetical protein
MAATKTPVNFYEFKLTLSTKSVFSKATLKEACAGIAGAVRERPGTLAVHAQQGVLQARGGSQQ